MTFLRTLLILILFYYGFKLIVKLLLPFFAQRWVKKAQERYNEQQGFVDPEQSKENEGEVKISSSEKQKPNTNKKEDLGDYIEFEEFTEDK